MKRTPLETYRRAKKMKQEDLAETLGVDQGWLSRVLNGHAQPSIELCLKIETITGVVMPRLRDVRRRRPARAGDRPLEETG